MVPLVSAAECVIAGDHLRSEWQLVEFLETSPCWAGIIYLFGIKPGRIWEEFARIERTMVPLVSADKRPSPFRVGVFVCPEIEE